MSELSLDPQAVKGRENTYTSITDFYHIDVFSNSFMEGLGRKMQKDKEAEEILHGNLFILPAQSYLNSDGLLLENLFLGETKEILKENNTHEADEAGGYIYLAVLAVLFLFLMLLWVRYRNKSRRKA